MLKSIISILLVLVSLFCAACGEQQSNDNHNGVRSVANYKFNGDPLKVEISKTPEKILVCGNSGAETLMALGAGEQITAVVLTDVFAEESLRKQLPKS